MYRSIVATLFVCAAVLAAACEKPKEEDCQRAVDNIRKLYGTDNSTQGVQPRAAVRACRGSATRESVRCVAAAQSLEQLAACTGDDEFLKSVKEGAPAAQPPQQQVQPQQQAPSQEQPAAAPPAQQDPAQQAPAQQQPTQQQPAPQQQPEPQPPAPQQQAPAQQPPPAGAE
jgi:hypothetical protein